MFCIPYDYNPNKMPDRVGNEISAEFDLTKVYEVNDFEETIEVNVRIDLTWYDSRILTRALYYIEDMSIKSLSDIWVPKLSIEGLIQMTENDVLTPAADFYLGRNNGSDYNLNHEANNKTIVHYTFNAHVKVSCPMDFANFPFDNQECIFRLFSPYYVASTIKINSFYSYSMESSWNGTGLIKKLQLQNFNVRTSNISERDRLIDGQLSAGGFKILIRRRSDSYRMQYYIPCGAAVVASWVSFLISPEIVPGRAGLLVTLFLVSMTIFQSIVENTPKSGGLTGLSSFAMVSNLYIGAAMLEYAVLLYLRRNIQNSAGTQRKAILPILKKKSNTNSFTRNIDNFCFKVDIFFLIMFSLTYSVYVIQTSMKNSSL